jgi:hypothetical protein
MNLVGITKIILKYRIKRENLLRKKKFISWDKVEKIALIIEKKDNINKSAIDTFVDSSKKYIEVFYIETKSKESSYSDWQCFSKKDKSFWNLPKKSIYYELKRKKFDIVVTTCSDTNFFAVALTSCINAPLKCSNISRYDYTDLIIKKAESLNLIAYLEETMRYLKMIRTE